MSKSHRAFALLFTAFFIAGAVIPIAFNSSPVTTISLVDTPYAPSTTAYVVNVRVFNALQAFNDDDFEFRVLNGTNPLNNAWVRLFNASTMALEDEEYTDGNGFAYFYNLPIGTYKWNVSHASDPITPDKTGQIVSNGPEANLNILFGNIDWDNDQDDLNATITDIEFNPANNLNFSIHYSSNDSIWAQVEVVDGNADFSDIPDGDYIWRLSVLDDPYYKGYLLDWGLLEANSTQQLVYQSIGPLTGNPDYYDLEVFTYYETSFEPLVGAQIQVMYKNGTIIDTKTTGSNGTVLFVDLPVAFINWTITYGGQPVGLGDYYYNLTSVSSDLRNPVITGPVDQDVLITSENVTITWHLEDEYPATIKVYVDDVLNVTVSWVNSTYDYVYNVSAAFPKFIIGVYEIKLVAYDQNNNFAEDVVSLRLYENITPVIESPDPVEFFFSETGYTLSWTVIDDYPSKYNITDNNETYASGSIDPIEPIISISLNGLAIGIHNFTIYVNDTSNNIAMSSVLVTVKADTTPPVITYSPGNIIYAQGDIVSIKNWTAVDDFKDYYTIIVDGVVGNAIDWVSDIIEFDFSGMLEGTHTVTLRVYDIGGNSAESTVTVTVTQSTVARYMFSIGLIAVGAIVLIAIIWFVRYR
ncbi:MAG: hypothetical protein JW779_02830 [Candidatus Thorarchaeota archaeon]|nr:hypothetical protein [Candidatus Thorarchaeota archaeon]